MNYSEGSVEFENLVDFTRMILDTEEQYENIAWLERTLRMFELRLRILEIQDKMRPFTSFNQPEELVR